MFQGRISGPVPVRSLWCDSRCDSRHPGLPWGRGLWRGARSDSCGARIGKERGQETAGRASGGRSRTVYVPLRGSEPPVAQLSLCSSETGGLWVLLKGSMLTWRAQGPVTHPQPSRMRVHTHTRCLTGILRLAEVQIEWGQQCLDFSETVSQRLHPKCSVAFTPTERARCVTHHVLPSQPSWVSLRVFSGQIIVRCCF